MQKAYANMHVKYALSIFIEFVKGRPTVPNSFSAAGRICKCALINVKFWATCVCWKTFWAVAIATTLFPLKVSTAYLQK